VGGGDVDGNCGGWKGWMAMVAVMMIVITMMAIMVEMTLSNDRLINDRLDSTMSIDL
jgi:hypothetical protein